MSIKHTAVSYYGLNYVEHAVSVFSDLRVQVTKDLPTVTYTYEETEDIALTDRRISGEIADFGIRYSTDDYCIRCYHEYPPLRNAMCPHTPSRTFPKGQFLSLIKWECLCSSILFGEQIQSNICFG